MNKYRFVILAHQHALYDDKKTQLHINALELLKNKSSQYVSDNYHTSLYENASDTQFVSPAVFDCAFKFAIDELELTLTHADMCFYYTVLFQHYMNSAIDSIIFDSDILTFNNDVDEQRLHAMYQQLSIKLI